MRMYVRAFEMTVVCRSFLLLQLQKLLLLLLLLLQHKYSNFCCQMPKCQWTYVLELCPLCHICMYDCSGRHAYTTYACMHVFAWHLLSQLAVAEFKVKKPKHFLRISVNVCRTLLCNQKFILNFCFYFFFQFFQFSLSCENIFRLKLCLCIWALFCHGKRFTNAQRFAVLNMQQQMDVDQTNQIFDKT